MCRCFSLSSCSSADRQTNERNDTHKIKPKVCSLIPKSKINERQIRSFDIGTWQTQHRRLNAWLPSGRNKCQWNSFCSNGYGTAQFKCEKVFLCYNEGCQQAKRDFIISNEFHVWRDLEISINQCLILLFFRRKHENKSRTSIQPPVFQKYLKEEQDKCKLSAVCLLAC